MCGHFTVEKAYYHTRQELLVCKECGAEDNLYNRNDTLFECKKCCYSTRPWNFSYKSQQAKLTDLIAKEREIEDGRRLTKRRLSRARKRAADLEACAAAASEMLRKIKKCKAEAIMEEKNNQ